MVVVERGRQVYTYSRLWNRNTVVQCNGGGRRDIGKRLSKILTSKNLHREASISSNQQHFVRSFTRSLNRETQRREGCEASRPAALLSATKSLIPIIGGKYYKRVKISVLPNCERIKIMCLYRNLMTWHLQNPVLMKACKSI